MGRYLSADMVMSCFLLCVGVAIADGDLVFDFKHQIPYLAKYYLGCRPLFFVLGIRITPLGEAAEEQKIHVPGDDQYDEQFEFYDIHRVFKYLAGNSCLAPTGFVKKTAFTVDCGIQLAVGPQPLWLRNHNSGLAHRIMVKRLATSPHDPLGITDSAYKNQLVVVSVQYGPFNPYIPIRSTTIGKSRVAIDPIAMHTSWRSNSDIASVTSIGYPRMSASGESSTTMHRLLHASGSHPIPTPYDPNATSSGQPSHQSRASVPDVRRCPAAQLHVAADQFAQQVHEVGMRVRRACVRSGANISLPCAASAQVTCMIAREEEGIQLAVGPQPLWLRNHNSGLANRIMVKRLATSPHDPLGITDSACKNQLVVVSVHYGPFNPYIPIRSTTIGKSRVAIDPIAMHTSWRSNSDIVSVTSIGYPRMSASGESSTTMHRLLHASGSHPIPTPYDPNLPEICCAYVQQVLNQISRTLLVVVVAQEVKLLCLCIHAFPILHSYSVAAIACIAVVSYQDARASGNTALSSPYWDLLATMRRVVNYHSSWARQRQVELFDASGNPGFTAVRGFNPAGGAPGGAPRLISFHGAGEADLGHTGGES
ncbi:hypothetical protein F511_38917 [Dorcoceras hygrometricum]|uniref:Uncharacterized protein n=1 Tax=Dorcoceras hygrometricum TaxID=472368 RepID=A0A2Z7CP53_9LAMI|nr:hypothetical protein F511_38917 [Dorcoceras hygrometricum]